MSVSAHISGQSTMGRFNFQECQRLIELFLELKCERANDFLSLCDCAIHLWLFLLFVIIALSAEPGCANVANGAVLWHLSRVMHDIDVHLKQREYASELHAEHFPKPSKILDGLLACAFFGVHFIYRDRLHRAHPASHATLLDFRPFVRAMLVEWSGRTATILWRADSCSHIFYVGRCESACTFSSSVSWLNVTYSTLSARRLFSLRASLVVVKTRQLLITLVLCRANMTFITALPVSSICPVAICVRIERFCVGSHKVPEDSVVGLHTVVTSRNCDRVPPPMEAPHKGQR